MINALASLEIRDIAFSLRETSCIGLRPCAIRPASRGHQAVSHYVRDNLDKEKKGII